MPVCIFGHRVPEGASSCPKCGAPIKKGARGARNVKLKLIEEYSDGLYTLTKGLKGEALWETDDEYCVVFRNVMDGHGTHMLSKPFWIPKKYLKKFSLIDYFF